MNRDYKINGGWEVRDGRTICRWMLVWVDLNQGEIAGCAAGYSGGGSFQLEKFYLMHRRGKIEFLQIDNEDKIHGEFADFSAVVPSQAVGICEDCQDEILSWHDERQWEETDNLCLREDKSLELKSDGDMLLNNGSEANLLISVLECMGLTSRPS